MKMICDTKITSGLIAILVIILTLSHRTTGGGSWKRLERMFIQDHHTSEHWDENRIIFPDMTRDPIKSSWRPTTTPRSDDTRKACEDNCHVSREYSPVCGTNGVTYQNMGQLQCAVKCGVAVDLYRPKACSTSIPIVRTTPVSLITTTPLMTTTQKNEEMERCTRECPSTPEYNPVCGTNRVTYSNIGKLQCAKFCGADVNLWRQLPCPTLPSSTVASTTNHDLNECTIHCPVTAEYRPVCGTDNVTYYNIAKLECAKFCGVDVSVQYPGRCTLLYNAQHSDSFGSTSEEDYSEEIINARHVPRRHQEYYWK